MDDDTRAVRRCASCLRLAVRHDCPICDRPAAAPAPPPPPWRADDPKWRRIAAMLLLLAPTTGCRAIDVKSMSVAVNVNLTLPVTPAK